MKSKPAVVSFREMYDADGNLIHWKREKWVRTNEDWYPSFKSNEKSPAWDRLEGFFRWNNPLDHKAVYVMMSLLTGGLWRVAVWGADDCGMEVDFRHKGTAQSVFDSITNEFTVTKSFLKSMGLHGA